MFLCVIIRISSLNTSFYIRFVFVFSKTYTNYYWVFSCFQNFYIGDDISDSIFAETDCKKALI